MNKQPKIAAKLIHAPVTLHRHRKRGVGMNTNRKMKESYLSTSHRMNSGQAARGASKRSIST